MRIESLPPQNYNVLYTAFASNLFYKHPLLTIDGSSFQTKMKPSEKRIIDFQTASPYKNRTILPINYSQYGAAAFETGLFQFGFFIDNVFAGNRIKFFDFQFAGHSAFVFGSGVFSQACHLLILA